MTTVNPMTDAELVQLIARDDAGFGALSCARGALPLTAMTVAAHVQGLVAAIELEQTFENTLAETIEATYVFPLPDRAAVTRFCMEVGGRVIDGVIEERGAAREQYDQAIAAGHRAAITEEDRAGVFTLRVGNLMPREVATVKLSLIGPLPVDDGEATFRFPLVVAPRYIPGAALPGPSAGNGVAADTDAAPDASRISPPVLLPGMPNPVRLAIRLTIDPAGVPMTAVRSSLHAVSESQRAGLHCIDLVPGERLDRDFIVRWSVGERVVRTSLVVAADAEGTGGTFLLTLVPPRASEETRPRDIVFVIDRSGSMAGWKMVAARRAVARMIDTLRERDRFAVLAFDNVIDTPADLPVTELATASDRNRFHAVEFLSRLEARGGTELAAPLTRAAHLVAGGHDDRDHVLVLATDGQVGNEDQILRELAPRLRNAWTFTLGIDQAVNAAFLRRLAAVGGGVCELVESEDRLDAVMDKVHRRIATPVVTELAIGSDDLRVDGASLAPRRLPALFAGAPVLIAGRLAVAPRTESGWIELAGRLPGGGSWRERVQVSRVDSGATPTAASIWARARIRDLEDLFAAGTGDHDALEKEIVATSLRHRVLSRFTAFLAVDRSSKVTTSVPPRPVMQSVEKPAGWRTSVMSVRTAVGVSNLDLGASTRRSGPSMTVKTQVGIMGMGTAPVEPWGMRTRTGVVSDSMTPGFSGGDEDEAEVALEPVDDASYRARALRVAEAIEAALKASAPIGLALQRLAELVEDVASIGGLFRLAGELFPLLDRLRGAHGTRHEAYVAAEVARDLRALGGAPSPSPSPLEPVVPGARRTFWK